MNNFTELWAVLREHGSSGKKENECAQLWETYSPAVQEQVYQLIKAKIAQGKFVHYDPMRAIQENAKALRSQTLSYAVYYARYHTTEPRDGWRMANPTGQKVIYVRGEVSG